VLAHFADGTIRDVTPIACYSSSDTAVADVSVNGLVTGSDRGEAATIVRYLEHIESCSLTFVKDIPGYVWSDPPATNYIDTHVEAKLRQLQYLPSGLANDDEFLRRVHLDCLGQLPTLEETRAFLADGTSDKRAKLIDKLLDRPEHAKFWALKWGDLLQNSLVSTFESATASNPPDESILQAVIDGTPDADLAERLRALQRHAVAHPENLRLLMWEALAYRDEAGPVAASLGNAWRDRIAGRSATSGGGADTAQLQLALAGLVLFPFAFPQGITIDAITPQNEPLHGGNNPSMVMQASEQASFIKSNLGPAFAAAAIATKIIVYDHNCDRPDYPIEILNDAAARAFVDGSAFHLYEGDHRSNHSPCHFLRIIPLLWKRTLCLPHVCKRPGLAGSGSQGFPRRSFHRALYCFFR
jgi:hypothetical protein